MKFDSRRIDCSWRRRTVAKNRFDTTKGDLFSYLNHYTIALHLFTIISTRSFVRMFFSLFLSPSISFLFFFTQVLVEVEIFGSIAFLPLVSNYFIILHSTYHYSSIYFWFLIITWKWKILCFFNALFCKFSSSLPFTFTVCNLFFITQNPSRMSKTFFTICPCLSTEVPLRKLQSSPKTEISEKNWDFNWDPANAECQSERNSKNSIK